MNAYERLLSLAVREHELAQDEDFEAMRRVDAERREIVATLPTQCPPAARPLVAEMARLQAATTALLQQARARVTGELGSLERRSDTARGYGRQATPSRGTFSAAA